MYAIKNIGKKKGALEFDLYNPLTYSFTSIATDYIQVQASITLYTDNSLDAKGKMIV